ncbi:MAG: aldo/keto reductase [Ruminiclostridium sp.]|nr:aldo/keto reductase [Ruminiclostridium sp.]MCF0136766.1 aldo/keto reductase [Oscillospiraceae bacterium]
MIYSEFQGEKLSLLGFGTMRLPLLPNGRDADIDQQQVDDMVDYAIAHGVNYFDTAMPYHEGMSEIAVGKSLARYPRDSFKLATKFPGHQTSDSYDPAAVFELQLRKCQVEYFDFYLLHNINENCINVYTDPKWGIIDYFIEQKRAGRIKHLGFSSHAGLECLGGFLEKYGKDMEFCQIQLNYMDWTLQQAKEKYELISRYDIPVWVMEPVRGGKLSGFGEELEARFKALRPEDSISSWGFRFLQGLPEVKMVLSGMSCMEHMVDNIKTFEERDPLSESENALVLETAELLKNAIPCTACRYCCKGCPAELDIPLLISLYNDFRVAPSFNISQRLDSMGADRHPSQCIGCGQCAAICPQKIDIPEKMREMTEAFGKLPKWDEICKAREAAMKKSMK